MKKFTAFVLSLILLLACVSGFAGCAVPKPTADYETPSEAEIAASAVYNHWKEFTAANPSRTTGTPGEVAAANYVKGKFESFGYPVQSQAFNADTMGYVNGVTAPVPSQNLIAKKEFEGNTRQVIVGAHYDNAAGMQSVDFMSLYGETTGGQGAFDNGSGVAVLLTLAERFADYPSLLPFDLVFVAFGAEEFGLLGAEHFVSSMTKQQKDSTLLMVNIDVVGFGDFNYVYGEDISNPQEDFFIDVSKKLDVYNPVRKMPKSSVAGLFGDGERPYYNTGHASDNYAFVKAGVPSAFFFSGNYGSKYFGYNETVAGGEAVNIMHSENDTVEYIENNCKDRFLLNLQTVTETIFTGLTDEGFAAAVKDARKSIVGQFWLSSLYAYAILVVCAAAVGLSGFGYYRKLQKASFTGTAEFRQKKEVDKPDVKDIFGDF